VKNFKQAVFVCLAGTFGLAFLCSWFIRPHGECAVTATYTIEY
jgi:hypothetical protein